MIKKCLKAIEENDLVFIEEIIAFVPFSKPTFYAHKINEVNSIKEAIENKKINIKSGLRKIWSQSKSAALQIALYRLIATEQEYECLVQQKVDYTSKGDSINPVEIVLNDPAAAKALKNRLNAKGTD